MREASKGGADGGRERCSTRGAARRLEKAAPEAAPWFLAHRKWDIRRRELWAAWQQEEGGARHWVGSGKGKKTDWYSRGGGVKLLQKKPAAAAETAVTGGAPLFSSREEEEED